MGTTLPTIAAYDGFNATIPTATTKYFVQNQTMKDVLMAPPHNIHDSRIYLSIVHNITLTPSGGPGTPITPSDVSTAMTALAMI